MNILPEELRDKGTYVILLKLAKDRSIKVGALGNCYFKQGYYTYIGSAFGPGGLYARLNHHYAVTTKPRWHIDYLRRHTVITEIWYAGGDSRLECFWSNCIGLAAGSSQPVAGFGASDCRCITHLYYFDRKPRTEVIKKLGINVSSVDLNIK